MTTQQLIIKAGGTMEDVDTWTRGEVEFDLEMLREAAGE